MRAFERLCNKIFGADANPLYQSGALAVFLLMVAMGSGVYLLLFYDVGHPHESVVALHDQALAGRWLRSLHRYASDAAMMAILFHVLKMWSSKRTWGRRARAWRSGWILLAGLMFCGWTGLVLVWDQLSFLMATEATRSLDVLPLFSEPLGQLFAEREVGHSFFFAILFLHVAVPLGLAGLYLLHVSSVARPAHQPPHKLRRYTFLALLILSVLLPVAPLGAADPNRIPGRVAFDLFYVGWLPLTRLLPAWSFWVLGLIVAGLVMAVPSWTKPKQSPEPSWVDENHCTGCTTCSDDCPYEAITMVIRDGPTSEDGRHSRYVARVDPDLCVSCGICAGSCAPMGVGPTGRRGRDQLNALKEWFLETQPQGKLVVVGCGLSAQELGDVVHYRVGCAGSVHTSVLEYLVRRGCLGVYLLSCPPRDCRNREGPKWARERLYNGREAELQERVDRRRVKMGSFACNEADLARADIEDFRASLASFQEAVAEDEPDLEVLCEEKPIEQV